MPVKQILLLCGGHSDEHEVSLQSAGNVLAGLAAAGHRVELRVITRRGGLLDAKDSHAALAAGRAHADGKPLLAALESALANVDVVFPVLHGPNGEDGTVQGLLRLVGVPTVGSQVLGSSLSMDKPMAKAVLQAAGMPQTPYRLVRQADLGDAAEATIERIVAEVSSPWFVKPANLGSSVGIRKVKEKSKLIAALRAAFQYDRRAIVEAGVEQVRELEVAVLGNDRPAASVVGEVRYQAEFYDYETKYTDGRSSMVVPALVPEGIAQQCRQMAIDTFVALDCAGLARVDFFYQEKSGRVLINEVNTMPGFTRFSMYPSMWAAAGKALPQLLDELVALALERSAGVAP